MIITQENLHILTSLPPPTPAKLDSTEQADNRVSDHLGLLISRSVVDICQIVCGIMEQLIRYNTLVLPLWCCRFGAATLVLPLWCCHFGAATLVLPLWCCHFGAATLVLPLWCCHFGAATLVLPLWSCHFGAATLQYKVFVFT